VGVRREGVSRTARKEGSVVEGQSFLSCRQFGPRRRNQPRQPLRPGLAALAKPLSAALSGLDENSLSGVFSKYFLLEQLMS
jgi:hypothetical protein